MADLSCDFVGIRAPNPFWLASAPPTDKAYNVNRAFEAPLNEGLRFERRLFHSLFGTADQQEGMTAFLEKRTPVFKHR